jgi:glycosyltransferase involved in cell wall biosynthesis
MKILFLDQSGDPGGAELCLLDIAQPYREDCLVGLLADGAFRQLLEENQFQVTVLTAKAIQVRKDSSLLQGLRSLFQLIPLIDKVFQLSQHYDLIYANTPKALVVGVLASAFSRRPLVYHLHDILSADHFSWINRRLAITMTNHFARLVIANSKATAAAFLAEGGNATRVEVVYNGFTSETYQVLPSTAALLRQELGWEQQFIVGHFSRLGPWKGQHVLIEALSRCPEQIVAIFVGGAFFGVEDYVAELHQQVERLGLQQRVKFLGFRSDIPQLMSACDLVTHTSIAPEPFGRVIVEAMLCGKPIIAANAGGAAEIVEQQTGWLTAPGDAAALATVIQQCAQQPEQTAAIANIAKTYAMQTFDLPTINKQLHGFLTHMLEIANHKD